MAISFAFTSASPQDRMAYQALSTLTNAQAVHSLSPEQASRKYPVHLRVVVIYYDPYIDPRHGALFVCDSTGCIFAAAPSIPVLPIQVGALVDLEGVSSAGDFAPIVDQARIKVLGQSRLPVAAPRVSLARLTTGSEDGQWVEVEGIVRSRVETAGIVTLQLAMSDGIISATTRSHQGINYDRLVDARILLHANVAPFFTRQHQMIAARLFFSSLD